MNKQLLRAPSVELVEYYLQKFESDEKWAAADRVLRELFDQRPSNHRLEDVLLKVAALNDLYYTQLFDSYQIAAHICGLDIDQQLEHRSLDLVEKIARVSIGTKQRRNYSFATKYCSWHSPESYPIFDSIVSSLLTDNRDVDRFADFTKQSLADDFSAFKRVVDQFRNFYDLSGFTYRQVDKFLWMYGRELSSTQRQ